MHPKGTFRDAGTDWLDFADARGFAHIFAGTTNGPMMVHAPVTRHGAALRFHVSRGNRIAPHLDGATVIASVSTVDGYISPSWYADPVDQVPTWNFVTVEIEGVARSLDDNAVTEQLDALAARHEPRVSPDKPWTRGKMDDALFHRMLRGIVGFELDVREIRETVKLSQHRPADLAGTVTGLRAAGHDALAEAMTQACTAA